MTLKQKFKEILTAFWIDNWEDECEKVADDFAIEFADWKDDNFLVYKDRTCYAKTSSQYFDVTKYISKEKPTKYYTTKELLEIYKKEKGL
jgi:hypothetical protein